MVRNAGMSRGCATCRKRRIKCDEKSPSCSQCSRGRRTCPGPIRGSIFLLTHRDNPRKRSRHEEDLLQETICHNPQQHAGANDVSHEEQLYSDQVNDANSYRLQADLYIPGKELTEIQLVSKFISFFAKSAPNKTKSENNTWMAMLPDIMSDDKSRRGVELRSAVLAASFALCRSRTNQDDNGNSITNLEIESRKFYLTSLKQQRVKMLLAAHSSEKIIPLAEDVAVAVMLAYYEVISPTFETSYFQHILGAKVLLEMIGPSNCREGYYHQLFQTVRLYMVHISITTQSLTSFSSEEWTEIPFSAGGKTSCDCIIDILLQLPRLKLSNTRNNKINDLSTTRFIETLKSIWASSGFCHQANRNMDMSDIHTDQTTKRKHEIEDGDLEFVPGPSTIPPNSETAITISFYSLAWILILDQVQVHDNPEMMELREKLLLGHCDAVLRACNYIEELEDGCAFIRTVFPLRSVALLSPSLMQREYAKYQLEFWRVSKGLGGICAIAMNQDKALNQFL